ncbi:MAG: PKD domain-containing protein [Bacteroidota bacterium]
MKSLILLFVFYFFLLSSNMVLAQRGKHGAKVVSAVNTIVNEYTTLTAAAVAGTTSITVAASSLNANGRFSGSLAAGDLIMIIQVQGATVMSGVGQIIDWGKITSYNNCGLYEFAQVLSVPNSTTINVECALVNSYTAAGRTEVVRVPRYTSLTINNGGVLTGDTWNGSVGGILAVEVEGATIVNSGGTMNMTGKGFRGGILNDDNYSWGIGEYYYPTNDYGAEKGEGIAGYQTDYDAMGGRYCRGAAANGGGGANTHNHGGGGGANAGDTSLWTGKGNPDISNASWITAWDLEGAGFSTSFSSGGGRGGYSFSSSNQNALTLGPWNTNGNSTAWNGDYRRYWGGLGGRPLDYSTGRIFMGGGGGAGEQNDTKGSSGANGGGIIYVQSYGTISGAGQIISNGATAPNSTSGNGITTQGADGAGGGGAGGTIILRSVGAVSGISATADGGAGGNQVINASYNSSQSQAEGPGGGGGGGYIAITSGAITCTTNGGANGTSNSSGVTEFIPNGATKGGAGINNASVTTFWIIDTDDTICPGTSVTLTASLGGTPPSGTTIIWYDAIVGGNVLGTGPTYTTPVLNTTTTYFVGSCTGTYHDSVTVYVNNTTANAGIDVTICNGATTQLNASGGVSYSWSPSYALSSTSIANPIANPAVTTTYIVTVTDGAGCTDSDDIVVTVSGNINANAGNNVSICPGSSTNLLASGGISYSWSPPTGLSSTSIANPIATPANTTSYIVTVTNASGCTDADTVVVSVYPPVNANAGNDTTICNSGSAQLNASGGISYTWSPATGLSSTGIYNPVATPVSTTTYTVTVTDVNGCTGSDNITVAISSNLIVNVSPSSATTCPGGSVQLTASGGTTYIWAPPAGLSATSGATVTATPAATTTYYVTATNAGGCSGSASVTVTIGANLVPAITPSSATVCSGSSVQLTASGGTTYTWSPATGLSTTTGATVTANPSVQTTYTVSVTDGAGCSGTASVTVNVGSNLLISVTPSSASICPGSSVQLVASGATNYTWSPATGLSSTNGSTVTASPAASILYSVTGTDASGCSGSTTVAVIISNTLSATASFTDENCGQSDGTATVTPAGTCVTGYTYQWNTVPPQTTQTATNLPAGTYIVTVSCGGCSATASTSVVNNPGPSAAIANLTDAGCGQNNGGATITVSGGTLPYTYIWSNGQSNATLANVAAGTYTITVQDANNCQAVNTVNIASLPGPLITIVSTTNASCFLANGGASISVAGGSSPYNYLWNSTPVQSTQNLQNVPAGNYTVTVTDGGGCTAAGSVYLSQTGGMLLTSVSTDEDCGQMNGTVTVVASQGTGTYNYSWNTSPPQDSSTVSGLGAGTYTVTVTDGACTSTTNVIVQSNPGPSAGFTAYPGVLTIGGEVNFSDNSSGNVVSWLWDFGDGSTPETTQSPDHEYSNIGTFLVTLIVTDANGCIDTYSDTVVVHDIFTLYIPNSFSPNDDGKNDYFAPKGLSVDPLNYDMAVFDRWGNCIFHTTQWNSANNQSEGWNGTVNNDGNAEEDIVMDVYVYRIRCKDLDGQKHQYIGHINLIP